MRRRDLMLAAAAASLAGCSTMTRQQPARRRVVIAHRGASGERPEHTLASYQLAIEQGADFIEPDLVPTRDGVLVCRHENEIGETTDVAQRREFDGRRTTKTVDGREVSGWFVEDFTLAELKTLRARERLPDLRVGNTAFDGQESIPTFREVLDLATAAWTRHRRAVGVYPELKHPSYFAGLGLPADTPLLQTLKEAGWDRADLPLFIQCFEPGTLKQLRGRTRGRLVQLIAAEGRPADGSARSFREMLSPAGLTLVADYADGIGPDKSLILPRDDQGAWTAPTRLVEDAHAAGLLVHPWTFRSENQFLPTPLRRGADPRDRGEALDEYVAFFRLGVDGVFSDHPADAVAIAASFSTA